MEIINVTIKGELFRVYAVTYLGRKVNVAEPKLEDAIQGCINNNEYCYDVASIEGKACSVEDVSDLYYYVYGDEDNDNPTEQDIIDSISDVWEGFPE